MTKPFYSLMSAARSWCLGALVVLASLAATGVATAQVVTIAQQNFSTTAPTTPWGYAINGATTISNTNTGSPASSRLFTGSDRSAQITNGVGQIVFDEVSTVGFKNMTLTLNVASIGNASGAGADAGDTVKVWVVTNTSTLPAGTVTPTVLSRGNANANWGYATANSQNVAVTLPNTTVAVSGAGNLANPSPNSYTITLPGGTTSVRFYVRMRNNATSEIWCLGNVKLEGEVGSDPFLNASASFGAFTGTTGAPGVSQAFNINGGDLTPAAGDITVTAPSGYEVSKDNSAFSTSVTYAYTSSALSNSTVFVRQSTSGPAGATSGNITITGGGASASLAVSGSRAVPFTAGNLAVSVIGTGVGSLSNAGNPLSVAEYTTTGSLVNTINIPTTGSTAITQSGTATSEGALSRNAPGTRLHFAGYNQSLPNATALANTVATTIPRGAASIGVNGDYSLDISTTTAYSPGNPRSATSTGSKLLVAGQANSGSEPTGGVRSGTTLQNALVTDLSNTRNVRIVNGRIVFSTATAATLVTQGLVTLGDGLDNTTLGQTVRQSLARPTGNTSIFDFAVSPDGMTIYAANDQNVGNGTTNDEGGVMRFDFNSTTQQYEWVRTFPTSAPTSTGGRFLVVEWGTPNVIYATSGGTSNNNLLKITDNGASGAYSTLVGNGTITVLATAGANRWFRGIDFTPVATAVRQASIVRGGLAGVSGTFTARPLGNGNFGGLLAGASATRQFYVTGTGLSSSNITVSVTGDYALSTGGSPASSVVINSSEIDADGNLAAKAVNITFEPVGAPGVRPGTITVSGGGLVTPVTFDITGDLVLPTNYYLSSSVAENSTVDLSIASNWNSNIDGVSGSAPAAFNADGQIFNINKNVTTTGNILLISGSASELRIADGKTLNAEVAVQAPISILGTGTLNVHEATPSYTLGTVSVNSTIAFVGSVAQTIPPVTYGNLVTGGTGNKTLSDNISVTGDLTLGGTPNAASANIFVAGDVTIPANATPTTAFSTTAILRLNSISAQNVSLNDKGVGELRVVDKTNGSVTFTSNATLGSLTVNSVNAIFNLGGQTISLTNNLSLDGNPAAYTWSGGTLRFIGTTGTQNIRNSNALNNVISPELPNLVINTTGTANVNFSPPAGGGTITAELLTINSTSTGNVNFQGNTLRLRTVLTQTAGNIANSGTLQFLSNVPRTLTTPINVPSLNISGGGVYTAGGQVTVRGNLTAGNRLAMGTHKLVFAGTSAQTVTANLTLTDVDFNNTAGVTIPSGSSLDIFGAATLGTNAAVINNGTVKLTGNSLRSGYLAAVPSGASWNGPITFDRFMGNLAGWYFMAMPVKGQTFLNLHARSPLFGIPGFATGNPNTFLFDDNTVTNNGWVPLASETQSMTGVGFRHFIKFTSLVPTNRFLFTGEPIIGDGGDAVNTGGTEAYTYSLTNANTGFNLIPNPYPASIEWNNTAAWSATNVSPTIHKWNSFTASYRTWNRNTSVGTAADGRIAGGMSYLVSSLAPGAMSLSVRETAKVASTNTFSARQGAPQALTLTLTNGTEKEDAAILLFNTNGSTARTLNDAAKLQGGIIDLGMVVNGSTYTVKELDENLTYQVVDLNTSSVLPGNHVLRIGGVASLPAGMMLSLRDNVSGTLTPITSDMDAQISLTNNGQVASRYSIVVQGRVTNLGTAVTSSVKVYPNPATGAQFTLEVSGAQAGESVLVRIMDAAGKTIETASYTSGGLQDRFMVTKPDLAGIYMVETQVAGRTSTQKLVVK